MRIFKFALFGTTLFALLVVGTVSVEGAGGMVIERRTLFADGDVPCTGADDFSTPVGKVMLMSGRGQAKHDAIFFIVILENAAPNWDYYVEFSQGGTCSEPERFHGLTTDENGDGAYVGVYHIPHGSYAFQVDIVSDPSDNVPPNEKHREISTAGLIYMTVR